MCLPRHHFNHITAIFALLQFVTALATMTLMIFQWNYLVTIAAHLVLACCVMIAILDFHGLESALVWAGLLRVHFLFMYILFSFDDT